MKWSDLLFKNRWLCLLVLRKWNSWLELIRIIHIHNQSFLTKSLPDIGARVNDKNMRMDKSWSPTTTTNIYCLFFYFFLAFWLFGRWSKPLRNLTRFYNMKGIKWIDLHVWSSYNPRDIYKSKVWCKKTQIWVKTELGHHLN